MSTHEAAILNELMSERRRGRVDLIITTMGLAALLTVGATCKGQLPWRTLNASGGNDRRVTVEDLQAMVDHGYLKRVGTYVEITDSGNDLIRELLNFTNAFEPQTTEANA